MSVVTAGMIKELRERTGVGMSKCKEALDTAHGDMDLAIANLRKAGFASAVKKEGRTTNEGAMGVHENEKSISVVEINSETDFVAKNDRFVAFLKDVVEQINTNHPSSLEDLLAQPWIQDSAETVDQARATVMQAIGENIVIKRFKTFEKGPKKSVGVYSHLGGKVVVVVEIEGASDVASLAKDIGMHIAASSPEYVAPENVPQNLLDQEKEIAATQIKDKPANIVEKIVEGKINAFYDAVCLLRQKYIKDDSLSIGELVEQEAKKKGTPLKVTSFIRWNIGQA